MIHPVVCNPILQPVVSVADPVRWRAGGGSTLPRLQPGEYFLTDEHGNYLTDEHGNYLIGKDS